MTTEIRVTSKEQVLQILESPEFENVLLWCWENTKAWSRATIKPPEEDILASHVLAEEIIREWELENPGKTLPRGLRSISEAVLAHFRPQDPREIRRVVDKLSVWEEPTIRSTHNTASQWLHIARG